MVTISRDKGIVTLSSCHTSRGNSFLPYIGMEKPTDLPFHLIFFFCHQFELTDKLHQLVPVQIGLF